jgi:cytoplasmic FMR1 interacting protein
VGVKIYDRAVSNQFLFSSFQSYLEESINNPSKNHEMLGDSVAWAGCTIMYLLGQQQHFELFDFSYQFLNVAEVESATVSHYQSSDRTRSSNLLQVRSFHIVFIFRFLFHSY